jgi:cation transport regulator
LPAPFPAHDDRAIIALDRFGGAVSMPDRTNDHLPPAVRAHLPPHARDIHREAFNSAWRQYVERGSGRENIAHRIAWAAVKRRYQKVGSVWALR